MSAEKIIAEWKQKKFKPVYWLEGEESFFIDEVMSYAEHHLLNESEASFNLNIFYGRDADWTMIINTCMRYPMFGERQVVLLKEAQQMKEIERLENYILHPLASTVFVVSYKEKKLDARTKFAKAIKQHAEVLSTKKIYENNLPEWIVDNVAQRGLSITSNAVMLLKDYIGNDLSRLSNEIEKLSLNVDERKKITEADIEKYIGISKEYNVFELQDALGHKNLHKAIRIIQYFNSNPKAGPIQLVLPTLYNFFSKIYTAAALGPPSENALKPLFYNNVFAARQAIVAINNFGMSGTEKIILLLHEYNLKSIGINNSGSNGDAELLKELVVKVVSI